jgi:hypothetical protein
MTSTFTSTDTRTLTSSTSQDAAASRVRGYAIGAATGDFNNDGCVDLYVTNLERSQLFRNACDGLLSRRVDRERSRESRVERLGGVCRLRPEMGGSILFVGNYVYYSVAGDKPCSSPDREPRRLLSAQCVPCAAGPPLSQQP